MPHIHRWIEPRNRESRAEYRALRRELKGSRTSKARRLEIEARLDAIAATTLSNVGSPVDGSPPANGSPAGKSIPLADTPTRPTTGDMLALCDRITSKPGFRPGRTPNAQCIIEGLDEFISKMTADSRQNAIRKAQNATDAERAAVLLEDLPDHPLRKLALECAQYLCQEDRSLPRPEPAQQARWIAASWLSRSPHNKTDLRGNADTVSAAVADVYQRLDERDLTEPNWYVQRVEQRFDVAEPAVKPKPVPLPTNPLPEAPRPVQAAPQSVALPTLTMGDRVRLVLACDCWLSNLATYNETVKSQIVAAITGELQRCGSVDATFSAKLYEKCRPKAMSQFPPRTGF
jgi:hypothetical protein